MHASELAQLAGLVSHHGPVFLRATPRLLADRLQSYWIASRCRLERWHRALRQALADLKRGRASPDLPALLEEILLGEILTRVWTSLVIAFDRRQGEIEAAPVARSIFLGHQEARHRTLELLLRSSSLAIEEAVLLNRLRRKAERWTDLLIGHFWEHDTDGELAFDPRRTADFAADMRDSYTSGQAGQSWPLMFASLQAAFQQRIAPRSPNADLNERIASSILACFGTELFDDLGLMHSLWAVRLMTTTSDTEGLLAELLELENPTAARRF